MADAYLAKEWADVKRLRQAVRDATTLPQRISALCNYQGALHGFVERRWALLEEAVHAKSTARK